MDRQQQQFGVSRLKELLFDHEREQLSDLQARLDHVAATESAKRQELAAALTRELRGHVDSQIGNHAQHLQAHAGQLQQLQQLSAAEHAELHALAGRLQLVFDKAGTDDSFRSSVASVLAKAIVEAEKKEGTASATAAGAIARSGSQAGDTKDGGKDEAKKANRPLARALAPLIVNTVKTEIRNNQAEMVEALYPVTGRMVKAYVASAIKDLNDQINQRLESRLTGNPVMLRLKGLVSGKSGADLALADSQRLVVEELFLIRRGSGELVQRWPQIIDGSGAGQLSNSDIHMSGVITAVNEFASHALKEDGNLRGFELDDCQIYLRASPAYLLAAKCRGVAPAGLEAKLDDEFLNVIDRNRAALSAPDEPPGSLLAPLAAALTTSVTEFETAGATVKRAGINPVKVISALILLPLLGWFGWRTWTAYETGRVRDHAETIIGEAASLEGYPVTLDVAPRGQVVTVSGLVPNARAKAEVGERLEQHLTGTKVQNRLTVLPAGVDPEPQISAVRRDITGLEQEITRRTVRRAVDRAQRRLAEVGPELARLEQLLVDEAKRGRVRSTAAELNKAVAELGASQSANESQLAALTRKLAAQLASAGDALAELMASTAANAALASPNPAVTSATDSEPTAGADALAEAAERLAAITYAVTQTAQIKPPPPVVIPGPTARERLSAWTRENAIFFGNAADYRSPDSTARMLDALAALMIDAKAFVRVVGYTDESGGSQRNSPLAQSRADKVTAALVERGVSRTSIVAIGRANGGDLSTVTGALSPNRRVEFEVGFTGEGGLTQGGATP